MKKTVLSLAVGMLIGFATSNLMHSEVAHADAVVEQEPSPPAPQTEQPAQPWSAGPMFQELAGGMCSDGQTCRTNADCGYCEGLACKCFIPRVGTCGCP